MAEIKRNLDNIMRRIAAAARRTGRDSNEIRLVAVSKRKSVEQIEEAYNCGQRIFGENYLQESLEKIASVAPDIQWHFIGHLQSNKAGSAAMAFGMIETVDRFKIGVALDRSLEGSGRILPVLAQINIGRETQKSGVLPEDAEALLKELHGLNNIRVHGLMVMPPYFENPEAVRPFFRQTRILAEELQAKGLLPGKGQIELSMGMSGDFEVAIEEGATLVRVGTALFGQR